MSTAIDSSGKYADCDEFIDYRIRVARSRIKWTDLLTALLLAGVLLIGYVLTFTVFDHWVVSGGFNPVTRAIMLGVVLISCALIVYRYVLRPWTREIHPLYAAKMLDGHEGMDGSLMSLIDLNTSNGTASEAIRRTMEKRAAVRLAEVNMDEAIDRRWLMQLGFILFALVVATCVYAVLSPKSINLLRPLSVSDAAVSTRTRILKVQPGATVIQAGEELEVIADIGGHVPEEVVVLYTTLDQTYVDEKLTMTATEDQGRFRVMMVGVTDRGLRQDFSYRVVAGDATSEQFAVSVDQPPSANVTQVSYTYPQYMTLPPRSTENGNLDVWEGTEVVLTAESNVPLQSAELKFSDDPTFSTPAEEVFLKVNGKKLSGRFQMELREDGSSAKYYRIDVTDTEGRTDPQPTVYAVNVRPDKAPLVRLLDPIRDLQVPANAIIPLLVEAEDPDFMLRSVKLNFEVNGEGRNPELLFDATRQGQQKSWTGTWEFAMEPLELEPGDVVRYHITARDNKPPLGRQSRTGVLQFNIEAPTTPEKVQERLAQDKELQEQQQRDQNEEPKPEPSETDSDEPQPAADEQQPPQNGDPENPEDQKQGDNQDAGSKPGNEGQKPGENGKTDGTEAGTENSDSQDGTAEGSKQDGSETAAEEGSKGAKKPPSDDEALQRLLEKYKESPPEQTSSADKNNTGDNSTPGSEPDANPNTTPGERNSNTQENPQPDENVNPATSDPPKPKDASETGDQNSVDRNPGPDGSENVDTELGNKQDDPASKSGEESPSVEKTDEDSPKQNGEIAADDQTTNPMPNEEGQKIDEPMQKGNEENPVSDVNKQDGGEAGKDPKQGGDEQGKDGDPKQRGDEQGKDGDPKQGGDEQGKDGDPKQGGDEQGKDGDPKQGGDEQGKDGDPKQRGDEQGKDGDPKQGGDEQGKDGDPKQGGDEQGKDGDPKQGGDEQGKDGDPKQGGDEQGKDGDPKQGGDEQGKDGDPKQGGDEQGGKDGQKGGDQSSQQGGKDGQKGGDQSGQQGGKDGQKGGDQSGQQGGKDGQKGGDQSGQQGGKDGQKGGDQSGQQGGKDGQKGGDQSSQQGGKDGQKGEQGDQQGKDGKKGGDQSQQGGKDGQKGGDQGGKQGGKDGGKGGKAGGKGGQKGGKPGGKGAESGKGKQSQSGSGRGGSNPAGGPGNKQPGSGDQGGADDGANGAGSGEEVSKSFTADDPNVTDAAQAADLALKRLQKDIDRGQVDKELLEELGWTEDQLKAFSERMQKQLDSLKDSSDGAPAELLQRRRVEELLKSLDLNSGTKTRVGKTVRDREQQDTTSQQSRPPQQYKDWLELYEKSLSEGRRRR